MCKQLGKFLFAILCGIVLLYPILSYADMSSSTYRIYADVISIGGGTFSSTTYNLNGTLGEPTIGIVTSSTYEIKGGFQFMDISEDGVLASISFEISTSTLNLGALSTTAVSQATTTATITTDSDNGYTLAISNTSTVITGVAGILSSVSDDSVTAGSEEYGIGLIGNNRVFTTDQAVTPRNISTTSTIVIGDQTDITFKASIDASTLGKIITQTVTFTASVNP